MNDDEAMTYLSSIGYKIEWGTIIGPLPLPGSKEEEAIDELLNEWDYEFKAIGD